MAAQELVPMEEAVRSSIQKADPLWFSADVVSQRVQLIQQVYRSIMKQDTHYGIVPGCAKPSLWKAGSEQLLMTFRLAAQPEVLDLSTADCAHFRVTVHVTHSPTGTYLGSGIGECSSDEAKYKWREATCTEEYDETPADRRRIKWASGKRGSYSKTQVRQEIADVANTVLKMAKKRAQIDATLTVTAASDIFTQDIEDMEHPVETEEVGRTSTPTPTAMPQRKSSASARPTAGPERRAENVTPPTAGKPCPDCGDPLSDDGCHYCGWVPDRPAMDEPIPQRPVQQAQQAHQPEPRQPGGRTISEPKQKRFFAICMSNGITKPEMKNYLKSTFGIDTDRDLLETDYERACAWAQGGGR